MSRLTRAFGLALLCAVVLHYVLSGIEAWALIQQTSGTTKSFGQIYLSCVTSGDRMSTAAMYVALLMVTVLLWNGTATWCIFACASLVTAITMWVVSARTIDPEKLDSLRSVSGTLHPLRNYGLSLMNGDTTAYLASVFVFALSAGYFTALRWLNARQLLTTDHESAAHKVSA